MDHYGLLWPGLPSQSRMNARAIFGVEYVIFIFVVEIDARIS